MPLPLDAPRTAAASGGRAPGRGERSTSHAAARRSPGRRPRRRLSPGDRLKRSARGAGQPRQLAGRPLDTVRPPTGFLGANGIKFHNGGVWVSNLDKGTVLRFPVTRDEQAGPVETRATGLVDIDDFAFTGHDDTLLAAINADNEIALVTPGGRHRVWLTGADGLENPTSVAVRGTTAYIASGAYFTDDDPNLLAVRVIPDR